jgi:hypothetical protein
MYLQWNSVTLRKLGLVLFGALNLVQNGLPSL